MEPVVGELQCPNTGSSNLLGLPEPCPWDSDDELSIGAIKPKSSPIPRRRSSLSCSDDDSQPPPSSSRRVSFADAFGLSLVSVKQFKTWSMGDSVDTLEVDLKDAKEYFLKLHFTLPLTLEELLCRVEHQKVDLENLELFPGTTTLKGTVRVLNMCFDKLVYIRTSLDCWSSHFDLLAEYVPESSNRVTDCFSFKLTLVPPFGARGARVDFCIRYETPFGSFWANNNGQNYLLFCHEKEKEQDENDKLKPKSCLKTCRHFSITSTTSDAEEIPEINLNCGIAVTEPVGVKEEKVPEEDTKLKQEEHSKTCSRRSRRKAARMAKLQQFFAQRDEKDVHQTEKDTDKVDVLVPAIDEAPLNLSTPETNVTSLLTNRRKTEGQESIAGSMDADRNQTSASHADTEEREIIPVIHPELITSESQIGQPPLDSANSHKYVIDSQLLESRQDKETITSQTVSPKCQILDNSIGKTVERAWECFEKCAMERIGSTADNYSSESKTNNVDKAVSENNQGSQSFDQCYTFETIVAPLYHQVFERMENNKRGVKNRASKPDEPVGKLNDGSRRQVTYPSVESRSSPEISAKHVNDDEYHGACKETFPEYLYNTNSATENALSVPNVKTEHVAANAFQDAALPDITHNLLEADISESKTAKAVTPIEKQHSSNSLPSVTWEETPIYQTPQMTILQGECSDDTEYSLENKPPYSGYSLNTLQQDLICIDSAILTTQSDVDATAAKPLPTIVTENPQYKGSLVSQTSFQTQVSNEIDKKQEEEPQTSVQTLNNDIRCLEKSYTSMPGSTLVNSDISSNVTPKSEALFPSQDSTQVTTQSQIPATIYFTQNLEVTEATISQLGTTDDRDLIQKTTNTFQNSDRFHHVGSEIESKSNHLSNRNVGVDDTETIQTEILHMGPKDTLVDMISQTFKDVSKIHENKEHRVSHLGFPDTVTDLNKNLGNSMAMSNICTNPKDALKEAEGIEQEEKENTQAKNHDKNEEQELTENQSVNVKEITEVGNWLEEKEEEKEKEEDVKENIHVKHSGKNGKQVWRDMTENQSENVTEITEVEKWLKEKEQQNEEQEEQEQRQKEEIEDVKENIQVKNPSKNEEKELTEKQSERVKEITEVEKGLEEKEKEDVKENIQVKDPGKNEKQELTDRTENQSEKEKIRERENQTEISEVEKWLEEKEQQKEKEEEEKENVKENIEVKYSGKNEEHKNKLTNNTENQLEKVKKIPVVEKCLEEKDLQEDIQEDLVEKEEQEKKMELGNEDKFKDGSNCTEDVKEVVKKDGKGKDAEPIINEVEWENKKDLEAEIEEPEMVCGVTSVSTLPKVTNIDAVIEEVHLHLEQQQQNTRLEQMSEEPESERHCNGEEKEIFYGKDSSRQAMKLNSDVAFGGRAEDVESNSEFVDQEEEVCCQTDKQHVAEDALGEVDALLGKQKRNCLNEQSENVDDSTSTDSLTDDEMEMYLLRLKNTQLSGLKDGISMIRRPSVSRAWTIPSPMPSISEYLDEDQPNALLDDLTNEQIMELERATLPLLDKEEEVPDPNLLWWREFFSSDNMTKMIAYIFLFVVFVITTYICDFIACFGLYLLALYWLYFQVQREPLKST